MVRLVGGDPFSDDGAVKEALAVARTVVPFEVVPGVPIELGTAAYAGVPAGSVRVCGDKVILGAAEGVALHQGSIDVSAGGAGQAAGRVAIASATATGIAPGATIAGPAVIAEDETSTFVSTSFDAHIDGAGSIVMERKAA